VDTFQAKRDKAKAEAARRYRQRKIGDAEYKRKEADRKKRQRQKLKEDESTEHKLRQKELSRMRQARYRERKKNTVPETVEANGDTALPTTVKRQTRAEHDRKKEYWRERKRIQRGNLSSQKKRRIREYDRNRKRRVPEFVPFRSQTESEQPLTGSDKPSTSTSQSAVRQKAYRVKKKLPKSPGKFADVMHHIVRNATPRKRTALRNLGITTSPIKAKKRLDTVVSSLRDTMTSLNKKNDPQSRIAKRCLAMSLKRVRGPKSYKHVAGELGIGYKFLRKYTRNTAQCDTDGNEQSLDSLFSVKKRKDALDPVTLERVAEHYAAAAAFVPDTRSVSKKTMTAKKVLNESVNSVFEDFKKLNPDTQISQSTFAKLRPKHVQTTKCQKLYQSRCEYCSNAKLKIATINKLCEKNRAAQCKISDRDHLLDITMCPKHEDDKFHKKTCIQRRCDDCGVANLHEHLKPLVDTVKDTNVTWQYWTTKSFTLPGNKTSTRKVLETKSGNILELIEELEKDAGTLAHHMLVASWQQHCFECVSKNPPVGAVVMHLDFSENFSTFYQQEISSAHWMKNLITIHPLVAYYSCPDCEGATSPVMDVLVFISDDNTHDNHAVQEFVTQAVQFLVEERHVEISKIYEFTDGCASQYKSRGPFADISFGQEDFGVQRTRMYFGSCHGKGPSDGAGAVTKTAARMAVIRGEAIIINALTMHAHLKLKRTRGRTIKNICNHSRREFFLVQNINRTRPERDIKTTVKGTRDMHEVRAISPGVICTRDLACVCSCCLAGGEACENEAYVEQWSIKRLNLKHPQTLRRWEQGGNGIVIFSQLFIQTKVDVPKF
jgi:hypothetical protein